MGYPKTFLLTPSRDRQVSNSAGRDRFCVLKAITIEGSRCCANEKDLNTRKDVISQNPRAFVAVLWANSIRKRNMAYQAWDSDPVIHFQ